MVFFSCGKEDVPPPPADTRFPFPLLRKDAAGDDTISGRDPGSFVGKFVVDMYYGTAVTPQKVDIVVMRNDNRANVKTLRANVTSFPASIEVTGTQLITLFDSTIELGDKFEIGADVTTKDGQKFEAFPDSGKPYGADTTALPGSRFSIVYVTACAFDKSSFAGWYTVVSNSIGPADWGELNAGDLVMVSPGAEENEILVYAYPYNEDIYSSSPTVCQVDPITFAVTIPRQLVGVAMYSHPYIWVEQSTGTINPCDDAITLNMTLSAVYYSAPGVPFDSYSQTGVLELRK